MFQAREAASRIEAAMASQRQGAGAEFSRRRLWRIFPSRPGGGS